MIEHRVELKGAGGEGGCAIEQSKNKIYAIGI